MTNSEVLTLETQTGLGWYYLLVTVFNLGIACYYYYARRDRNQTAIWGTVANPEFAALHLKYYQEMIGWLCRHRVLWELSMTGGAVFTLALEIGFPFLVWNRRLRWLMVIGSVLLHTGIALFMGLTGFSLMMLALLVAFIPPSTVRQLLGLAQRVPALASAAVPAPSAAPAVGVR